MTATSRTNSRLSDLRARMVETSTDLVALGPSSHMAWLSGVHPHGDERPVLLLVSQDYAGFLMPALNGAAARQSTDLPFHAWRDDDGPTGALNELLAACKATGPRLKVALDETMRTDFALRLLDAMDAPSRCFTEDTVGVLRASKDAAEFDAIKAAHLLNDLAMTAAFDALTIGVTEREIQAVIAASYKAHGADLEFCSVCFGASGAFPHHYSSNAKLTPDTAVLIDTGCRLNGYPSDMTRCGFFGTPTERYKNVFDTVERAVQAALAAAKPGVKACDVDKAARDVIAAAGYGDKFLHRTGHGLGIDIHEPPYIAGNSTAVLAKGNVFSIEPGIYISGNFGVRLEEIVILDDSGPEIFSEMPRDMIRRP
ncbi:Xaa-Pro peptidase family protein [Pseudoruegeria sp. SK021]|uniref:M24 family metallopeptidase n=1 Tax=Pseudoruegeria sp. SK021 TaxID=1933035 RepID=UPI000A22A052|nr:Xaa-Pro peptidase family protein [Pseudoruegeria sp. SK021]OSP54131.1 peptidase M24 [Pseudoruegeria sp. SK021]